MKLTRIGSVAEQIVKASVSLLKFALAMTLPDDSCLIHVVADGNAAAVDEPFCSVGCG